MSEVKAIAHIENDFETKFALPRQSGLVEEIRGRIVFEPEFANPDALRGLEEYSHLWLLWLFSENERPDAAFQPTVRPPVLGGNVRKGVFATRSPFRPNGIGLSSVRLEKIEWDTGRGPVLHICGADLKNGTPVIDIKPYIPDWDSHPDACGGFGGKKEKRSRKLTVHWSEQAYSFYRERLSENSFRVLERVLEEDPRPAYQDDPERIYGFPYAGLEVKFQIKDGAVYILTPEESL